MLLKGDLHHQDSLNSEIIFFPLYLFIVIIIIFNIIVVFVISVLVVYLFNLLE